LADGRPAPTQKAFLRRRRPTPGAPAPWEADFNRREGADAWRVSAWRGRFPIGAKAFGRRSAWAPNEFGLGRPLADGRPAPTQKAFLRRRRPTPGAPAPWEADFNRREGADAWRVSAWRGRFPIGAKAFGRRSAWAPNEFGLGRPLADGRPAPTQKASFASAEADAGRGAPWEADFNQRESLRPTVGLRRSKEHLLRRRRPTPGAQRPGRPISIGVRVEHLLRRRRPTPGAQRLGRLISISAKAFGPRSACADRESIFCVGGGRRLARQRLERPISIGGGI